MKPEKPCDESPSLVPASDEAANSSLDSGPRDGHRPKERIKGLDGLRGIAALGVLIHHFTTSYEVNYSFKGWLPFNFSDGVYGVPLFFLISGFVIFMTVERVKRPLDFATSRFVRLFPAFWLSVLIAFALLCVVPGPDQPLGWGRLLRRTAASLTMVADWFSIGTINHAYWTLSVEMTFYVIIFFMLYWKRLDWTVPVLTGLVILGAIDGLIARQWPNPVSPLLRSILSLDYVQVLLMGVLLYKSRRAVQPVYVLITLLCLAAQFTQIERKHYDPVKTTLVTVVLAFVVFLATTGRLRFLEWRPLVFLGTISYSLYLNHSVMGTRIIYHAQRSGFSPSVSIVMATLAAILLATAITFCFEQPVSAALRRRIESRAERVFPEASCRVDIRSRLRVGRESGDEPFIGKTLRLVTPQMDG